MGVMNQKNEQSINDNCVTFDELEGSCFDEFAIDLTPKVIRLSKARQERNEIRMARRRERLNK